MLHAPFEDRICAGRCLAHELALCELPPDGIVVALAPGGVPVGYAVADRLHLGLDVTSARRIAVPWQREITIGAVVGTDYVLDGELISSMGISACELADIIPDGIENCALENALYHRQVAALPVYGHPVIVVDDGLATGDTMLAAVRSIRRAGPSLLVAAAPVGPVGAFARLRGEADKVVGVHTPQRFHTIGEHYQCYDLIDAAEIQKLLLASRRQSHRAGTPALAGDNSSCTFGAAHGK